MTQTVTMSYEEQRTLRSVAGRAAVNDLTVRQQRAFESGDRQTWLGTFVVEGVLELPGREPLTGHGALASFLAEAPRDRLVMTVDSVVQIDGVRGTQESRVLVAERRSEGGNGSGAGNPEVQIRQVLALTDELIYERGRWYFGRRTVRPA